MRIFTVGRIYKCDYWNFKKDPKPLLFVIYSNIKYVEGINLNYLTNPLAKKMMDFIMMYNEMLEGLPITGLMLYNLLVHHVPEIPRRAYRKYFYKYISGICVSAGLKDEVPYGYADEKIYGGYNHKYITYLNNILDEGVFEKEKEGFREQGKRISKRVIRNLNLIRKYSL